LKGSGWDLTEVLSRHVPEKTEEDQENLSQYSWCPGQDSKSVPPKALSRASPLDQPVQWLIDFLEIYYEHYVTFNAEFLKYESYVEVVSEYGNHVNKA
jgi:hypothetical protein